MPLLRFLIPFLFMVTVTASTAWSETDHPLPISMPLTDATPEIRINNELAYEAYLLRGQRNLDLNVRLAGPPPIPTITRDKVEYTFTSELASWNSPAGLLENADQPKAVWTAPGDVGDHPITVEITRHYFRKEKPGLVEYIFGVKPDEIIQSIAAQVIVIVPANSSELKDGVLDGYTIGKYPDAKTVRNNVYIKSHASLYEIPHYFYRVTAENEKYFITRRFRLGDFDMNFDYMQTGFPEYIALKMKFVHKLEKVIDVLVEEGYPVTRFDLISGYRSPHYNFGSIAEGADLKKKFSRHMWGDSADLIVDEDHDGVMDDLNQDGKTDCEDARLIFLAGEKVDKELLESDIETVGGRGLYSRHDALEREIQTPYCHIDARGLLPSDAKSLIVWYEGCSSSPPANKKKDEK